MSINFTKKTHECSRDPNVLNDEVGKERERNSEDRQQRNQARSERDGPTRVEL